MSLYCLSRRSGPETVDRRVLVKAYPRKSFVRVLALGLVLAIALPVAAEPSLQETMDGIVTRLYANLDKEALAKLDNDAVLAFITPEEREVLATKYWYFDVNVPVVVSVLRKIEQPVIPFWLPEAGFVKTDLTVKDNENWATYEVWQKDFDAGRVELGINGFDKERGVYLTCVGPQKRGATVAITNLFPEGEAVIEMRDGAWKYRDWDTLYLADVPKSLKGQLLLTSFRGRAREAHLIGAFRTTAFPSSETPDQVTLTWSEDPRTTQTIQWRTNTDVKDGVVRYRGKGGSEDTEVKAERKVIQDRLLMNDRYIHHYTAVLRGLEPGTTYAYSVGSAGADVWSDKAEFTSAPGDDAPFSFMCFADTHHKAEWGDLLHGAFQKHPETAFYMIAGDVVSTGLDRNEWDDMLEFAAGVSERKPMAFSLGNHDDQDGLGAWLPLALYEFPDNGPEGVEAEQNFSFRYGNALFLVLSVSTPRDIQAKWMEDQLANTDATWKFVVFHFPLYSAEEDYPDTRRDWGKIFDKYHVDMTFHGHVHYYLRTHPMNNLKPVESPADGTIYTISIGIAGRTYKLPDAKWVAKRSVGPAVYPRIEIDGNRLTYQAYGMDGEVLDELVIEK
jgi:Purple acid Phosphatase, N-terminal domain/Calcineurin-like phosphoesterase